MQDLGMNTYRVGGAVRDTLLGLPIHETDWVVVGGSAEQMRAAGFTQVGRDFPVFLHPETKEEFALARTERKSGQGHHGFVVHASPSVTLEEDLQRRDLTVNAMAMSEDGTIIDPYGGQRDLQERILRHVSPHFVEDPLRVLRVARFAARYHHLGFSVASETLSLMAEIVTANELAHLSAERVWVETEKALGAQHPEVYWQVLDACGAVAALAPELAVTHGVSGLARAAKTTRRSDCRWAALLSDLPEARATDLSKRLKAPNAHTLLAARVCRWRPQMKSALRDPATCMALLSGLDALRREEPFRGFCEALVSLENNAASANSAVDALSEARKAAQLIKAADFSSTHLEGPALGMAIREAQIEQITGVLSRLIQGR